jgi:hypothetical protein
LLLYQPYVQGLSKVPPGHGEGSTTEE